MSKYTEKYLESHCVDVFFKTNNTPIHILTDGTYLPDSLNHREHNRLLQHITSIIENEWIDYERIEINHEYINRISRENDSQNITNDDILRMFAPMAQLGFHSYDCVRETENHKGHYVWVARPKKTHPIVLDLLPFLVTYEIKGLDSDMINEFDL